MIAGDLSERGTQLGFDPCDDISIAAAIPSKFRLKTGVSSNNEHNSLYVGANHTGSTSFDAVLMPELTSSATFFLNGSNIQYDSGRSIPWGIDLAGDENYAQWESVTINAGYGTRGFIIDLSTGLKWIDAEFGGWLVCDWWHGAAQLFWIVSNAATTFPCSCSKVTLEVESL
ncbi:hypothetical protein V8E54_000039 [Elaphomyces granulatus]